MGGDPRPKKDRYVANGATTAGRLLDAATEGLGVLALACHAVRDVVASELLSDLGTSGYVSGPNVAALV